MNKLLLVSIVALSVGGCAMSQNESNGALIGGAIGAVAGAAIANATAPHRHCWHNDYGHWVCRYY